MKRFANNGASVVFNYRYGSGIAHYLQITETICRAKRPRPFVHSLILALIRRSRLFVATTSRPLRFFGILFPFISLERRERLLSIRRRCGVSESNNGFPLAGSTVHAVERVRWTFGKKHV